MRWLFLIVLAAMSACQEARPASTGSPDASTASASDAGEPDGGGVPNCPELRGASQLSDPRLTSNACVFDRWRAEFPTLDAAAQRARVSTYLGQGATLANSFGNEVPLRSGPRVIFIADASAGAPRVAGDWNGWNPANGPMEPLAQSGFSYREETLAPGRHAYKFVNPSGAVWTRDPFARWIEFDGVNTGGVGAFNSVVYTSGATLDRGLLRLLPAVHSPELNNDREVYVYVPPSAFVSQQRYPSLYIADGNESLSRGQFDRVADTTFAAKKAREAILVFVALHDQAERMDDYTFDTATARGPLYRTFVASTLRFLVDGAFPTIDAPASRGVCGASLGGLISAYIAWGRPEVFGLVGSQSGSFFWPEPNQEHFLQLVQGAQGASIRFYLDNGTPGDNDTWNDHLAAALRSKGYDTTHVVEQGAQHDWAFWAGRWPGMLAWLLPPSGG